MESLSVAQRRFPRPMTIGVLGCGTVGGGVVTRVLRHGHVLDYCKAEIRRVLVRDLGALRPDGAEPLLTLDPALVLNDPEIDVVVEAIGGTADAKTFVEWALHRRKHVVTANKALVSAHGGELSRLAYEKGLAFRYEAAVGGAVPVIRNVEDVLAGEPIVEISGVMNGTSNYIISRMRAGATFDAALVEAQEAGYAEADPSMDVDGIDAAQKLAILIALAFRRRVRVADIARTSLRALVPEDFVAAAEGGYAIVPLAFARASGETIEATVAPALVPVDHVFARLRGPENAIRIVGEYSGELCFTGTGAGRNATASAVLADLAEIGHRFQRWLPQAIAPVDLPAGRTVPAGLQVVRFHERPQGLTFPFVHAA